MPEISKNRSFAKRAYLRARSPTGLLDERRAELGEREIRTLINLAEEVGFEFDRSYNFLDLGCADKFLEPACKAKGWKYLGIDYDQVDFERDLLPFADDSIDIAASLAVIEHVREPDLFLGEIFRLLKPGGLIYLSTPNFQLDFKNFYNDPTHVKPYTPTSIEEMLRLHGFLDVATFPGLRCKDIGWYRGRFRFLKAFYLLPFRGDSSLPVPSFLRGHARSIFAIGRKPI